MKTLALAGAALVLNGCVITRTHFLNSTNLNAVDFSKVDDMKEGRDCIKRYLALFGPFGTQSVKSAATNGKIQKISFVDETREPGFLVSQHCVVVYGK